MLTVTYHDSVIKKVPAHIFASYDTNYDVEKQKQKNEKRKDKTCWMNISYILEASDSVLPMHSDTDQCTV